MFTKPTVFVLGAGVSVPFGFPSGDKLLQILSGKVNTKTDSNWQETLRLHEKVVQLLKAIPEHPNSTLDSDMVDRFVTSLKAADPPSIDTWLTHHKEYNELGKVAIATIISHFEAKSKSDAYESDDWFKWIFHAMCKNVRTIAGFDGNKITFITFNYDRLLEWKLEKQIRNFFGDDSKRKDNAVKVIFSKIFHVHGELGLKNCGKMPDNYGQISLNKIGQGMQNQEQLLRTFGEIAQAHSKSIRIIGEGTNNRSEIHPDVKHHLEQAEKIVFLGFGYDEDNLELLQLQGKAETVKTLGMATEDIDFPIVGTGYLLANGQRRDAIAELNGKLRIGSKELTCVPFCNEWVSVKSL